MDLPLGSIKALYALDVTLLEKAEKGRRTENYILSDGSKKYFLKKHYNSKEEEVAAMCLAERFFAEGEVPVILPILSNRGEAFFRYEAGLYSLYPFVEGRHLERGTLSGVAAVSLGATLGILHKRGKNSAVPITERFTPWDKGQFLAKAEAIEAVTPAQKSEFDLLAYESLQLKKRFVEENSLTYEQLELPEDCLIHGDYFCDNVFFDQKDTVTHVFDFEKVQYASGPYELFRSLFVTFFSIPNEENLTHAKQYVDSYLSVCPFPVDLLHKSLTAAYLKQIHSLLVEEEHYLMGSERKDDILLSQLPLNRYYLPNSKKIHSFLLGD